MVMQLIRKIFYIHVHDNIAYVHIYICALVHVCTLFTFVLTDPLKSSVTRELEADASVLSCNIAVIYYIKV